jgi:hypothetical protein
MIAGRSLDTAVILKVADVIDGLIRVDYALKKLNILRVFGLIDPARILLRKRNYSVN